MRDDTQDRNRSVEGDDFHRGGDRSGSLTPRLKDVAIRAGVSTATTSRVLNGKGYVSDELRERVQVALEELNYSPDGIARSMSQRRTMTVGLVVSDITNPFFTSLARGAEDASHENAYSVVLCNTDEDLEKERRYVSILREKRVDGIMLAVAGPEVEHVRRLYEGGTNMVLIDRAIPGSGIPTVQVDNFGGVFSATRYLLDLGHTRIGMVTGNLGITTGSERLRGFESALGLTGIQVDKKLLVEGGFHEGDAYQAGLKLCGLDYPPSAVISWGNAATTGLLLALRDCGRRVPDDVSVIGFDDLPYFMLLDHPITVIAQPGYELGRKACELLIRIIKGDPYLAPDDLQVQLPTELIMRGSCRRV